MTAKGFVFTINNDTFEDLQAVVDLYEHFDYVVFGFEVGEKGTPHIQGYCFTRQPIRPTALSKLLKRAYISKAKGTPQQNYDYCSKQGEFYEFGDLPVKGNRTDLDELVNMINTGASREEIKEKYPKMYFMYKKKIEEMVSPTKCNTKFYVKKASMNKYEDIQEIHEYFGTLEQPAVLFDKLDNITDYGEEYKNVIFYPDEYKSEHGMYPLGYPLMYKYGYERKPIKATKFIIVTESPSLYTSYKLI